MSETYLDMSLLAELNREYLAKEYNEREEQRRFDVKGTAAAGEEDSNPNSLFSVFPAYLLRSPCAFSSRTAPHQLNPPVWDAVCFAFPGPYADSLLGRYYGERGSLFRDLLRCDKINPMTTFTREVFVEYLQSLDPSFRSVATSPLRATSPSREGVRRATTAASSIAIASPTLFTPSPTASTTFTTASPASSVRLQTAVVATPPSSVAGEGNGGSVGGGGGADGTGGGGDAGVVDGGDNDTNTAVEGAVSSPGASRPSSSSSSPQRLLLPSFLRTRFAPLFSLSVALLNPEYQRRQEEREREEEARRKEEAEMESFTFEPEIDKKSALLARKRRFLFCWE
jgi:hypothetical protein